MTIELHINKTSKRMCNFANIAEPFRDRFFEYINESKNTKKKKESTLASEFDAFVKYSSVFLDLKKIYCLSTIDEVFIREFVTYLRTIVRANGRKLSNSQNRNVFLYLKSFLIWLSKYYPDEACSTAYFNPNPFSRGNTLKIKTKALEYAVLEQFKKAIRKEDNIYHKACFSVALYQGLRSEDIMQLEADCLVEDIDNKGKYNLYYYNMKSGEWKKKRTFAQVIKALKILIDETKILRKDSGEKRIFIHQIETTRYGVVGSIKRYNSKLPNSWLKTFIKKHNIVDGNGALIKMHMHQFRTTLLTNMDAGGIDIEIAAYQADHKYSSTTQRYYIHSIDKTYNEQMDILDKVAESIKVADKISVIQDIESQTDINTLRVDAGYCHDTKMLTDNEYICEHYKNRGNCYGCSKMVTTPEFLPYFYELLRDKKHELEDKSRYSEHILRQIRFEMSLIKTLIEKLETLKKVTG